jgi:hypothetical protein
VMRWPEECPNESARHAALAEIRAMLEEARDWRSRSVSVRTADEERADD